MCPGLDDSLFQSGKWRQISWIHQTLKNRKLSTLDGNIDSWMVFTWRHQLATLIRKCRNCTAVLSLVIAQRFDGANYFGIWSKAFSVWVRKTSQFCCTGGAIGVCPVYLLLFQICTCPRRGVSYLGVWQTAVPSFSMVWKLTFNPSS